MKDCTEAELEDARPDKEAEECINHCLRRLYKDRKLEITDEVTTKLTYEELIGALLLGRDAAIQLKETQQKLAEAEQELADAEEALIYEHEDYYKKCFCQQPLEQL